MLRYRPPLTSETWEVVEGGSDGQLGIRAQAGLLLKSKTTTQWEYA